MKKSRHQHPAGEVIMVNVVVSSFP